MNEKYLQEILIQILYCSLNGISDHHGLRERLTPEVIVIRPGWASAACAAGIIASRSSSV